MMNSAELAVVPICEIDGRDVVLSVNGGNSADSYHAHVAGGYIKTDPTWKFVFDWVNPSDTVMDLGANLGTFSVPLAAKGATVYGFEMLEENISHLKRSIDQNDLRTLNLVEGAVSDKPGFLGAGGFSAWGTVTEDSPNRVRAVVIDQWSIEAGIKKVDFIKIDIEGSEMAALRGARGLIERDKPDMVIEANVLTCGSAGYGYPDIIAFLETLGYSSFRIANGHLIESAPHPQPCIITDYFFSVRSRADIERRSPIPLVASSLQDEIDTIVEQDIYGRLHQAYVLAVESSLPSEVARNTAVSEKLEKWRRVEDDEDIIATLQLGAGVGVSV